MELVLARELFFVLAVAALGGLVAKFLKFQPIVGYLVFGVIFGNLFPLKGFSTQTLAQIGIILLLFSIGLEMSFSRLGKMLKPALIAGILQILLSFGLLYLFLVLLQIESTAALILAAGFSLSSTAVVFKILADRGELDTIHGELTVGWLLVQDLAVVPIAVMLPILVKTAGGGNWLMPSALALGKATLTVVGSVILGRFLVPALFHKIAAANSRELLVLSAVSLALGTAVFTSFLGISPALGAFLAGLVISGSQESHAVFAETRPLRDLFLALFFVTLGFLIKLPVVFSHLGLILGISLAVLMVKSVVSWLLTLALGFHGKTAIATGLGLAQIGEFSFVIYSLALGLGLMSSEMASLGFSAAILTLMATPLMFKAVNPLWRKMRFLSGKSSFWHRIVSGYEKKEAALGFRDHIIICGFGRVGGWVGRALAALAVPYVVVDYNQAVVSAEKKKGTPVIYGDPGEAEVLEQAGIGEAKAIVIAIPDRIAQEEIISFVQTKYPNLKIISRVHEDADFEKMKLLRVSKIIQPEFEASIAMVKAIMGSMGKNDLEIRQRIKSLRLAKAKI